MEKYLFTDRELRDGTSSDHASYFQYIENSALSSGIYILKAGESDPQKPHSEDELYYVMEGKSRFEVNDLNYAVGPGDVIYVPAFDPHRFYDIEEDLKLLVFFSKFPVNRG